MTEQPFAAGADFLKRALAVPAKVAADLAVAGGILRCGTCGTEQPLGDVGAHLSHGWPRCCGLTMTWVTRKILLAERQEVPEGCELFPLESPDWRTETGRECRAQVKRVKCGAPAVAALNRRMHLRARTMVPARTVDAWWPYCADHMYAYWVEDGKVWSWALREAL